jgi:hypothetical protein
MVNESYDPDDREEDVLNVLKEEGRVNPYLVRQRTEYGKGEINTSLKSLSDAGWIRRVCRGLYEFVEDPRGQTGTAVDWQDQLHDDLVAMGVTGSDRDRVEALAAFFAEHGTLSRRLALENEVVSEWGWDQAKDLLAETSVVERPDQRTWRWVGEGE